jgi:hypothetical protein
MGPIDVRAPKEPFQVQAEIKPVQVQLPKEDVHVTASGIPEKITFASELKAIPFDVRWPKDPLNISIDLKNGSAGPKDSEFQKVIDTFTQLNRDCKEQLNDLNKKLADATEWPPCISLGRGSYPGEPIPRAICYDKLATMRNIHRWAFFFIAVGIALWMSDVSPQLGIIIFVIGLVGLMIAWVVR